MPYGSEINQLLKWYNSLQLCSVHSISSSLTIYLACLCLIATRIANFLLSMGSNARILNVFQTLTLLPSELSPFWDIEIKIEKSVSNDKVLEINEIKIEIMAPID